MTSSKDVIEGMAVLTSICISHSHSHAARAMRILIASNVCQRRKNAALIVSGFTVIPHSCSRTRCTNNIDLWNGVVVLVDSRIGIDITLSSSILDHPLHDLS
ncbi:hypothetical protein Tco_0836164 [Tanacetum coccineum]